MTVGYAVKTAEKSTVKGWQFKEFKEFEEFAALASLGFLKIRSLSENFWRQLFEINSPINAHPAILAASGGQKIPVKLEKIGITEAFKENITKKRKTRIRLSNLTRNQAFHSLQGFL